MTYIDALPSELRIPPDKLMQSSVNKNTIIYNINTQVVKFWKVADEVHQNY